MREGHDFDPKGAVRPVDRQKWLREATGRLRTHVNRCIPCLQYEAGLKAEARCAVRRQIEGQIELLNTAIRRQDTCDTSS